MTFFFSESEFDYIFLRQGTEHIYTNSIYDQRRGAELALLFSRTEIRRERDRLNWEIV